MEGSREGWKEGKEGGRSAEDARGGRRGTEPEPESPARKLLTVKTESKEDRLTKKMKSLNTWCCCRKPREAAAAGASPRVASWKQPLCWRKRT